MLEATVFISYTDANNRWTRLDTALPLNLRQRAARAAYEHAGQPPSSISTIKISFDSAKRVKLERLSDETEGAMPADVIGKIATEPLSQSSLSSTSESHVFSQNSAFDPEFKLSDTEILLDSDYAEAPANFCEQKFDPSSENCFDALMMQQKLVVFEENLKELFTVCRIQGCGAPIDFLEKSLKGSAITVKWRCEKLHAGKWCSQPKVKKFVKAGNILIPAAVTVCGLTYARVAELFELLRIPFVSSSYFYDHQRQYVYHAVKDAWEAERKTTLDLLRLRIQN